DQRVAVHVGIGGQPGVIHTCEARAYLVDRGGTPPGPDDDRPHAESGQLQHRCPTTLRARPDAYAASLRCAVTMAAPPSTSRSRGGGLTAGSGSKVALQRRVVPRAGGSPGSNAGRDRASVTSQPQIRNAWLASRPAATRPSMMSLADSSVSTPTNAVSV